MQSNKRLVPDIEWYNLNQLLPPITRLIEQVDGITVDFVAQCLGIDPKKVSSSFTPAEGGTGGDGVLPAAVMKAETQKSLKERTIAKFKVKCPYCTHENEVSGIFALKKQQQ